MIFLYLFILVNLTLYSYFLIDPNLTFFQTSWWEIFRNNAVYIGYYRRDISWLIYFAIIISLFIFHFLFIKKIKNLDPLKLAFLIGFILLFSYPFLSHDFFNYMFDAKIVTFYQKNPYFYKALDFPSDPWLRFMHWTHRTYPYGPVFLLITLVPSFFSFGKFVLSFLFFKMAFFIFYFAGVFFLNKLNKKWAVIFATNPLIIIEGLVNSHNDLIGVSLAIIGVFYLLKSKGLKSRLLFFLSAGIKYVTLPLLFLSRDKKKMNRFIFVGIIGALIYLSFKSEIQPWYFLNLFLFIPFNAQLINRLNIFFFGLLISYYPYIRLGGWDKPEKIILKHWIIAVAAIVNAIYLFLLHKVKLKEK